MNHHRLIASGLFLLSPCVNAEFFTGNELLDRLQDPSKRLTGMAYVMGAFDALQSTVHCPPANITAGQVIDMVRQHLESSPETRHLSADRHIGYVLKRTWPCAKQNNSERGA